MAIVSFTAAADMNNFDFPGIWSLRGGTSMYDFYTSTGAINIDIAIFGNNLVVGGGDIDILTGFVTTMSLDSSDDGYAPNIFITGINYTLTTADAYDPFMQQPTSLLAKFLAGNDVFTGSAEADNILGFGGNDTFLLSGGSDTYNGGTGNDTVSYNGASAGLFAGLEDTGFNTGAAAGDSYVSIENLVGTAHNDTLYGTDLVNRFTGGNGNDTFVGKGGADTFNGGAGSDTVGYDTSTSGVRADLLLPATNTGDALGDVYIGIENLAGSSFGDTLSGNGVINVLRGTLYPALASGQDILDGRGGNDFLFGYDDNDRLIGGPGNDRLYGGLGADRFVFNAALSSTTNVDTVGDFSVNIDDFELENGIFTTLGAAGALNPNLFWKSATGLAHDANDRIVYNAVTGVLTYDANGNAAGGTTTIAVLSNKAAITAADFTVI